MKEWVSGSELLGIPGLPQDRKSLFRLGESGRLIRRRRTVGKGWEYHLSSLPAETQAYLAAQPLKGVGIPSSGINVPPPATSRLAGSRLASNSGELSGATAGSDPHSNPSSPTSLNLGGQALPAGGGDAPNGLFYSQAPSRSEGEELGTPSGKPLPDLQAWAAQRALRLSLKDLQSDAVRAKLGAAVAVEGAAWGEREATISRLATQHGVAPVTIRRWVMEVDGWRVKARTPQVQMLETAIDLPASRSFDPEAVRRGIEIYAGSLRSGRLAAYRALQAEAGERGWRLGDYSSFTRLMGRVPERFWEYIRKGETGFELGVTPKIIRAWLSVPAYSVLCGDQNIPDYQVYEPSTGEIYTPQLYLWMDCTSRYWAGLWPAWGNYSKYTVGYALREACRIATPEEIFTDWGKPELSHYTGQILEGLRGTGIVNSGDWNDYRGRFAARDELEDGIRHRVTTRVGIPWQKPIEPQMAVLKREYLNRFTPGFRQRLPGAWENDQRQAELKRARERGLLLSTEEFLTLTRDIVADHNAKAFRPKETSIPIVPVQVLADGLRARPLAVFDDLTLDLIFLPRVSRTPHQSTVRVQVGPGDLRQFHTPELSRVPRGKRVQVSFDPFDPSKDALITGPEGDTYTAEPWTVQQPGDRAGLSHKIARQIELMAWWKEQIKALRGPVSSVPRIAPVTRIARKLAEALAAKPDAGAAKRADLALIERYGA